MKKGFSAVIAVLAIILAVFNVVVFVLPIPRNDSFWAAYVFATIAVLLQIMIHVIAFKRGTGLRSIFFGLPTVTIGGIYLFLQLLWSALVMAAVLVPVAITISVSVVLLGWCLVSVIMTSVSRDVIDAMDEKVRVKTDFIRKNQVALELLIKRTEDSSLKKELTELRDAIRYSDPISNVGLVSLENRIESGIVELDDSVNSKDNEMSFRLVNKIREMLSERNMMIKAKK